MRLCRSAGVPFMCGFSRMNANATRLGYALGYACDGPSRPTSLITGVVSSLSDAGPESALGRLPHREPDLRMDDLHDRARCASAGHTGGLQHRGRPRATSVMADLLPSSTCNSFSREHRRCARPLAGIASSATPSPPPTWPEATFRLGVLLLRNLRIRKAPSSPGGCRSGSGAGTGVGPST